ncbi:hypothetical protein LTR84_007722 [Exophiala bonariae]|uniref:RecQ-mediated genome instability protein 1 n=1 Tax=Exophiala bonariae TaxID=1690606 RepID=A0AAV9NL80_9EURO|nr:hypothetical protein LTR84_007722 [Exophiala bonariae]
MPPPPPAPPATLHPLHAQLSTSLLTRHHLAVSPGWLSEFLSSRGPNATLPPLPALTSTAHFRVLASDIRTSLCQQALDVLPADVAEVTVKERRLDGAVVVQVLDVVDVGSSKWSQVEAIERVERGEEVRGREVIRTVAEDVGGGGGGNSTTSTSTSGSTAPTATATAKKLTSGPHKLLVQDARGTQVFAFEVVKVPKIALSIAASASASASAAAATTTAAMNQAQAPLQNMPIEDPGMLIGCKLLLRPGTAVRRGVVMLRPEDCVVLGGKVDTWDRKWKAERKERLLALVVEGASGAAAG